MRNSIGSMGHLSIVNPAYKHVVDEEGFIPGQKVPNPVVRRIPSDFMETDFPSESFDLIVGSWSVPMYLTTHEYPDFLRRVVKMLAPGGLGVFQPITVAKMGDERLDVLKEVLGDFPGYAAILVPVENSTFKKSDTICDLRLEIRKK